MQIEITISLTKEPESLFVGTSLTIMMKISQKLKRLFIFLSNLKLYPNIGSLLYTNGKIATRRPLVSLGNGLRTGFLSIGRA